MYSPFHTTGFNNGVGVGGYSFKLTSGNLGPLNGFFRLRIAIDEEKIRSPALLLVPFGALSIWLTQGLT